MLKCEQTKIWRDQILDITTNGRGVINMIEYEEKWKGIVSKRESEAEINLDSSNW
jgi:hypothetical protein